MSKQRIRRISPPSVSELTDGVLNGDTTLLARAITLVESTHRDHQQQSYEIIENCLSKRTQSIRVGITGVPGVGKSTFIESLGTAMTARGKKVAVLAVDPTSSLSRGSILGDKTRMPLLANDPLAFIRPSPSGNSLGGVARKTRESIVLCEAAGFDVVFIETVGVGQSETAVHSMVDFFLLLKLAGAGDELQGIKRGIMEMADAVVINKADGANLKRALRAKSDFERALHLYPPKENSWSPKVLTCSAIENKGISEIWDLVEDYVKLTRENGSFEKNRKSQNKFWFLQTAERLLTQGFYQNPKIAKELSEMTRKVEKNEISPFRAAEELLSSYRQQLK
ncbi:MAG: methylmalonyl Co-A mutase-associated GTPase MeaB [Flavobacteriaceae bacterium]